MNEIAASPTERRRAELSLYLEQLDQARGAGENWTALTEGARLDEWELEQLDQALQQTTEAWHPLLLEGVAYQIKLETDLGFLTPVHERSPEENLELRNLMVQDLALGLALLEETQRSVNQMVLAGQMDEATRLTSFRNKIGQGVQRIKGDLSPEEFAAATARSEQLCEEKEEAEWRSTDFQPIANIPAPTPTPTAKPTVRMVQRHDVGQQQRPLKGLLFVLGASICLWAVLILPKITSKNELPTLTLGDISPRSEIRHVEARPPSLFVELDGEAWTTMSNEARLTLIDDVGKAAEAAGYMGAQFKLDSGTRVARWLKQRGSELVD